MEKIFISTNEIEFSVDKIKDYMSKEEVLLTKIKSSLLDNFDNDYKSSNMSKMHASCSSLGYYSYIIVDNRKKYVLTLNKVVSIYKAAAKKAEMVLDRSKGEMK